MTESIDENKPPERRRRDFLVLGVALTAAVATAVTAAVLVRVVEHRQEAKNPFFRVVEIDDDTEDPAVWGKNFPLHYDGYRRTVDMIRTRYGGSEAVPRMPSHADPRSIVAQSRLEQDPRLAIMWSGYAFARDFREERGHAYMLDDQTYTERQIAAKQPGTCLHCHASVYVPYRRLGDGDLLLGFERMNQMPFAEARELVSHPIACIDCHDPSTMQLRITRPGFIEGMRTLKASEGIADYDVNVMATRQEMRSFVCGQCHVEYYFEGPEKRLVYPWSRGLRADEILGSYEESGFSDWSHADTGAPMLKAQHPEFELWSQGIHARSGVACADCHMPYRREGALKISDHHVRSPLLDVAGACQTCHRVAEGELLERVDRIQRTTHELRDRAMDAVVALVDDLAVARESASSESLGKAQSFHRRAQFLLDFIEAENSTGFHAPQEAARVLAQSIDLARQGQLAVHGVQTAPTPP